MLSATVAPSPVIRKLIAHKKHSSPSSAVSFINQIGNKPIEKDDYEKDSLVSPPRRTRAIIRCVSECGNQPNRQVLSVTKSGPEQMCCSSATDAPLVPNEWVYTLQVRVGSKVYEVKYENALDYFPTALVTGRSVDGRLDHGRMYLETPTGELKASVIGQHQAKSDTLAQSAR